MGRPRKIFTKREYERLSKTHEGRQHIRKTYAGSAFCVCAFSIFGIVFGALNPIIQSLAVISALVCVVSLFIGIGYILAAKTAEQEEAERLHNEEQRRLEAEKTAKREAQIRAQKEQERIEKLKLSDMESIDKMSGHTFEEFISAILSDLGYSCQATKKSGDFGADLIVEKENTKSIIQLKRYSQKVSVSAIQEITTAQNYYGIHNAWVITNNYFTKPAIELAKSNNIQLLDRDKLVDIILQSKKQKDNLSETACALDTTVEELWREEK